MSTDVQQRPAAWEGFIGGNWETNVDVRDFIQKNYTPYEGDASFLAPATEATTKLWADVMEGIKVENRTHEPYKIDAQVVSGITSHAPGYIDKDLETIVGLQTDEPLKRSIMPFGGLKISPQNQACGSVSVTTTGVPSLMVFFLQCFIFP